MLHDAPAHISIAECARRLTLAGDTIERSALSRYCDTHGLKRGTEGRAALVDYDEVQAHRAASFTREVMSGRAIETPRLAATNAAAPANLDARRRKEAAQATQEEIATARMLGEIVDIAEVDAAAAVTIAALRRAFAGEVASAARHLAASLDLPPEAARKVRAALKSFARAGQHAFADTAAQLLKAANEDASDARHRLNTLAAHAIRLRGRDEARARLAA